MDARSQRSVLGEKRGVFTQTTRKWKAPGNGKPVVFRKWKGYEMIIDDL
jgi:hypothetical protein